MLPHVSDRPLSLVRCPLGLAGDRFFQRSRGQGFPEAIRGVAIPGEDDDGESQSMCVRETAGLVGLAQMGTMEVHTWGCRIDNLDRPDVLVLDLDPGPGITWPDIVASAHFVHDLLDELGLVSFVKTSGGAGVHLVIPVVRRSDWAEAKSFTRGIAKTLAARAPMNFVATISKDRRDQRVFVDYLRNGRGATAVAPYSPRARNGATVSLPLAWEALSPDEPPTAYTIRTVLEHLAGDDPWAEFFDVRQSITHAMRAAVGL